MGCEFSHKELSTKDVTDNNISVSNFKMIKIVGRGGFGRVWKVEQKSNKVKMAMKIMSKVRVYEKDCISNIMTELNLLKKVDHPFIVQAHYAFQDKENLYLIMDYLSGGDMRYHLWSKVKFNEEQLRLEYLHFNNTIHRDLKPENLIFEKNGYIRIGDLGVANFVEKDGEYVDSSGTLGYMAPEVLHSMHHAFPVDYFSLGVIMYEVMIGKRPYKSKSRRDLKVEMLNSDIKINKEMVPPGWRLECADFTNKLLKRKASTRLGYSGILELKNHPWIKDYDWIKLYDKQILAPFIPNTNDNFSSIRLVTSDPDCKDSGQVLKMLHKSKEFSSYYFNKSEKDIAALSHKILSLQFNNPVYNTPKFQEVLYKKKLNLKTLKQTISPFYLNNYDIAEIPLKNNGFDFNRSCYFDLADSKFSVDMVSSLIEIKRSTLKDAEGRKEGELEEIEEEKNVN